MQSLISEHLSDRLVAGGVVWIVDDSPLERAVARRTLEGHHEVRDFGDGMSIVEAMIAERRPDVLVLDYALPGMTGVEVTRFLRAKHGRVELPILIVSGSHAASNDVVEGLRAGANDYLLKPYASPELLARVDGLLEAKRARERAARAEGELRRLLEQLPDPVFAVDQAGLLSFVNAAAARMLRRGADALVGRRLTDEVPALAPLASLPEGARAADVAFGERVYSPVIGRLALDEQVGETLSIMLRDVTDKAQAIAQRDRFLATLAHELRNPLAPILSAMQLAQMRPDDLRVGERTRAVVHRQVERLIRIVDDLLDVSRVSRGRVEINLEPVDVADVVARALESAEPFIVSRRHEVVWSPPTQPLVAMADPLRFEQMLSNLLHNAAKYSEPGRHIWVRAESDGEAVVVTVRDEGMGIAPSMQEAIFEMFVQVDDSLHRAAGGLGIGLPLVRQLASLQGGTVTVESAGLGHGSVFRLRMPSALGQAPAVQAARPGAVPALRPLRVHLVDDNADAVDLLGEALSIAGHEVRISRDGESAIGDAERFLPDVILLDIGLPGRNGYELATAIRAHHQLSQTTLVAVTGYGQPDDVSRARASGFDHHVVKPVSIASIARLLDAVGRR